MRVVVQRVSRASVAIGNETIAHIGKGYLLLVGLSASDDERTVAYIAGKIAKLRVFPDASGKMNLSIGDVGGDILSVSQFTLYGDVSDGNRPSFTKAMQQEVAEGLYHNFLKRLREVLDCRIEDGRFGADMAVELVNDGPVTIILEREKNPHSI